MRVRSFILVTLIALAATMAIAQSSDVNFPTALTTNAISGTIKPRDIGDSRLTTYYLTFGAEQGDLFLSFISKNFDGDVDVFAADGMKPLTKLVIYSDGNTNETGRLIYLRKPEKLILRLQGRPPGDLPATFQIKFAGSFVAAKASGQDDAPTVAGVSDTSVNSVGTINEKPVARQTESKVASEAVAVTEVAKDSIDVKPAKVQKPKPQKPVVEVTEVYKKAEVAKEPRPKAERVEKPKEPANPLANIRLLIVFKDGRKVDRPMTEVVRVNVDGPNLVVILKDGRIGNYSLLDVEKFTIQ